MKNYIYIYYTSQQRQNEIKFKEILYELCTMLTKPQKILIL